MLKNYRFGFDIWGLLLFVAIMIPNFIWFAIPAPNDILRGDSITGTLDTAASICQVLMIAILCVVANRERKKMGVTPFIVGMFICLALYFISWIIYYLGITNTVVVLGLTVPPCLAFLFFAVDRKNLMTVIPITIWRIWAMKLKNVLIAVQDIERAKQFYHNLFGLDMVLDNNGNLIEVGTPM